MFDFLMGNSTYPVKAEWFKKNVQETVDDEVDYEGAVPITYRFIKREAVSNTDLTGLKGNKYNLIIRTKDKFNYDRGDLIRVQDKTYKIESAIEVENNSYKNVRIIYEHFIDYEIEITLS